MNHTKNTLSPIRFRFIFMALVLSVRNFGFFVQKTPLPYSKILCIPINVCVFHTIPINTVYNWTCNSLSTLLYNKIFFRLESTSLVFEYSSKQTKTIFYLVPVKEFELFNC